MKHVKTFEDVKPINETYHPTVEDFEEAILDILQDAQIELNEKEWNTLWNPVRIISNFYSKRCI